MTEFHSIAHYVKDETGHFYHYHLGVQEAIEAEKIPFRAYVQRNALLPSSHCWSKTFHGFHNKKSRAHFFKDCKALFRSKTNNKRIFFLESFHRRDFFLIALSALLFSRKRDHFWILYRDDLTTRRKKDRFIIKSCSKLLQWKLRKKFLPLTDSEPLAAYYQPWFSQSLQILPVMHAKYEVRKIPSKQKQRLVLSWPGAPRPEKGLKEIQKLVQIQDSSADRFILELSGATPFPEVTNGITIQLQKMQLTENEYFENLRRSDVVLLPYDSERYRWRTSGIFIEAIAAGKIPVVKEGSWLAEELLRFELSELILDWNNLHFFSDLYELFYKKTIHEKLLKIQESYKAFHSKENFHKKIKELLLTV